VSSAASAPASKSFFGRLRERLNKGRAWLTDDLFGVFGKGIDEQTLEALETQLLMADVGVEATSWLLEQLQRPAAPQADGSRSVAERLRACIVELLAPLEVPLDPGTARPFVILVVGVNGTGKTTTIGKLAHRFAADGLSVVLAAGDTFRAAAVEQLGEWGRRTGAAIVSQAEGADPAAVVHDALESARARGTDIVIADTAGRLHTASGLMDELEKIKRVVKRFDPDAPHETLLVLDASQGQNALAQAAEFHRRLGVSGLVITKLDGTAKGGIVLAIARKLGLPIRFIAVGETAADFDVFRADDFARALVGEPRG
jgi:fused signal recognition particle receptor